MWIREGTSFVRLLHIAHVEVVQFQYAFNVKSIQLSLSM
jgi:hypothetical protein